MQNLKKAFLLLSFAATLASGIGCASTDAENVSERPWNAPKSWEHGIPTGLTQPGY